VTKLSLLLKVLEAGANALSGQMALLGERVLPDLGHNIKCGNSLIGDDFFDGQLFPDQREYERVNPFDWKSQFPAAFAAGGFDAVIGNPPYIRIQTMKEWAPQEVEFYKQRYRAAGKGNYDIYVVFVEKGLELLSDRGRLGYILPHKFFNAKYGELLRGLIAEGQHLEQVVHFGAEQVFSNATTYTCLIFLVHAPKTEFDFVKVHELVSWRREDIAVRGKISAESVGVDEWNFVVGEGVNLINRLHTLPHVLGDIADIFVGLQTSADRVFTFEDRGELERGVSRILCKSPIGSIQNSV
jgi:hypothetical protein